MDVIRKKLTPAEISNPNLRYNSDCDCIQQTSDGGSTWFDQPLQDPRTSDAYLIPPVSSDDPACDAAASIIANFRDSLTKTLLAISGGANAVGAASLLLTLLDFLSGIGLFIQFLIDFCALLISIGVTGVEDAFTDDVYAQLQCIIQCDVAADGSISADQFAKIQSDVQATFGTLSDVNLVFQGWLAPLGNVGLQNISALKHVTGDCTGCDCVWCYEWPDTASMLLDSWTHSIDTGASDFWSGGFVASLTKISFGFSTDGVGLGGDSGAAIWLSPAFTDRVLLTTPLSGVPSPIEWIDAAISVAGGISFGLNVATGSGGLCEVLSLHLEGVGARPAWTHGEDCT